MPQRPTEIHKDLITRVQESIFVSRKISTRMIEKNIKPNDIADFCLRNFNKSYSVQFIGRILGGGKGNGVNLYHFASAVGFTKNEYLEICYQAVGGLNILPEININTLEGLDLENEDLIRVVMKREMGKEPTENDIQTILSVIKMKKGN